MEFQPWTKGYGQYLTTCFSWTQDRIEELNIIARNHAENGTHNMQNPRSGHIIDQLPNSSMVMGVLFLILFLLL